MARSNMRAAVARAYQQAIPPTAGGTSPAVKRAKKPMKLADIQPPKKAKRY